MPTRLQRVRSVAVLAVAAWPLAALAAGPSPQPLNLIAAVEETLDNHLELQIQRQRIEASRATKQLASSAFDRNLLVDGTHGRTVSPLTARRRAGLEPQAASGGSVVSNRTMLSLSSSKLYRNGLRITPYLSAQRLSGVRIDPLTGNADDRGGTTYSNGGFEIAFPLLKGRGRDNITAREVSADLSLDAARLDGRHLAAALVMSTVTKYWEYSAQREIQDIREGAERRGAAILENVQILIDADREPASSYYTAAANVAQRTAARIAADQASLAANQRLAVAIGASLDRIDASYLPTDQLPPAAGARASAVRFKPVQAIISESLERRADYHAQRSRVRSARIVLNSSLNQLQPKLDLSVNLDYSGLKEGQSAWTSFQALASNMRGPNISAGLLYDFTRANNLARSENRQAMAEQTSRELAMRNLSRQIGAEVVTAINALENAVQRLEKARNAVTEFMRALDAEREKLGLGTGSIVDILTVEDRLTEALQIEIYARLSYAISLIELRFVTGEIFPANASDIVIRFDNLTTVPSAILGGKP